MKGSQMSNHIATTDYIPHLIVAEKGVSETPSTPTFRGGNLVVATLSGKRERVPGGTETLEGGIAEGRDRRPILQIKHVKQVVDTDLRSRDLYNQVEQAAEELRLKFFQRSVLTIKQSRITGPRTLVTVVRYPIHVQPKGMSLSAKVLKQKLIEDPEYFNGFEVRCSFVQAVRRGSVDPGNFEVRSWEGEMPITLPREIDLFRIVDIHSHIRGARAFMDRAEASEVTHTKYGTQDVATGRRIGGSNPPPTNPLKLLDESSS